jgi:hypothetical protein
MYVICLIHFRNAFPKVILIYLYFRRTSTESIASSPWTPPDGGDVLSTTTTSRSRHSTATLDGGGGPTPSYSPEEADTHFKRYSGGGGRIAPVATVQEPKLPDPEEDGAAAMSGGILNGEAAGRVDDEKCLLWLFAKRIKFAKKCHKFTSEVYDYFVLNSFFGCSRKE